MTLTRLALLPALLVFACSEPPAERLQPPAAQGVAVVVTPPEAVVESGGVVPFAAAVTGTADGAVTWAALPSGCGSVSPQGLYTAPGAAAVCQVVATSAADPARSAAAQVTVTAPPPPPVVVQIAPSTGAVAACESLALAATVTGGAVGTSRAVTWSVQEGAAGGTVTAEGVYTAPSGAGTYHVVATSVADGTSAAVAALTVEERVLSVSISPATITVAAGGTAQFTATVTTTCGSFASARTISASAAGVVTAN